MIYITERWSVYRDPYQWVLVETYTGKDKKGNPKTHMKETYHPWLDQAMRWAAEKDCEGKTTFKGVEDAYKTLADDLTASVGAMEHQVRALDVYLSDRSHGLSRPLSIN